MMTICFHLHFVDVGWMVPAAAELTGSFAAAIRNETLIFCFLDPHAVRPVRVVVTTTALKLQGREAN